MLVGSYDPAAQRMLAASDLNVVYRVTEDVPRELLDRSKSVFDRYRCRGFEFVGPQSS